MVHTQKASTIFYGLTTCVHCKELHAFLEEKGLYYETFWVDQEKGEKRADLLRRVKAVNPRISFPTIIFENGRVVVGGDKEAIDEVIKEIDIEEQVTKEEKKEEKQAYQDSLLIETMMEKIAPLQKKQGYIFNPYDTLAKDLMQELLICKEKFGYMCCPCRIASGNREKDSDIICPCKYRALDVEEYGVCFCGLYTLEDTSTCPKKGTVVPDRRPPEKIKE